MQGPSWLSILPPGARQAIFVLFVLAAFAWGVLIGAGMVQSFVDKRVHAVTDGQIHTLSEEYRRTAIHEAAQMVYIRHLLDAERDMREKLGMPKITLEEIRAEVQRSLDVDFKYFEGSTPDGVEIPTQHRTDQ